MSSQRATVLSVADEAILTVLVHGPFSTGEIAARIRRDARAAWSERHGYDFEWETDEELPGARLLAMCEARERGLLLHSWKIRPRLYSLERRGRVSRLQIDGHRPMLWTLAPPADPREKP